MARKKTRTLESTKWMHRARLAVFALLAIGSFIALFWCKIILLDGDLSSETKRNYEIAVIFCDISFVVFGVGIILDLINTKKLCEETINTTADAFVKETCHVEYIRKEYSPEQAKELFVKAYFREAGKEPDKHSPAVENCLLHLLSSVYAREDRATIHYHPVEGDPKIFRKWVKRTLTLRNPNKIEHIFGNEFGYTLLAPGSPLKGIQVKELKIGAKTYTEKEIAKALVLTEVETDSKSSYKGKARFDEIIKPKNFDEHGDCKIEYVMECYFPMEDSVSLFASKYLVEDFCYDVHFHGNSFKPSVIGLFSFSSSARRAKRASSKDEVKDDYQQEKTSADGENITSYQIENDKEPLLPGDGFCIKF